MCQLASCTGRLKASCVTVSWQLFLCRFSCFLMSSRLTVCEYLSSVVASLTACSECKAGLRRSVCHFGAFKWKRSYCARSYIGHPFFSANANPSWGGAQCKLEKVRVCSSIRACIHKRFSRPSRAGPFLRLCSKSEQNLVSSRRGAV